MEDELYDSMTADEYAFSTFVIERANDLVKSKNESIVRENAALRMSQHKATERIMDLNKQIEDLPKIKKAAHKQAVTDLFCGFNVRQDVWVVGAEYLHTPCTACVDGKIPITLEGEPSSVRCPKCDGKAKVSTRNYVPKQKRITSLSYEISERGSTNFVYVSAYLRDDSKQKIEELYHTEEECKVEVNRKNGE